MSKPGVGLLGFSRARRFTFGPKRLSVMKPAQMQGNVLELVGNNPEQRNWKGILIAFLVILIVCSFVVLAVVLLSKEEKNRRATIQLNDVIYREWKDGLALDARWIGNTLVWSDMHGNVRKMTYPSTESDVIIPNNITKDLDITDFSVSADFNYALLAHSKKQINSYSYTALYIIYNIRSGTRSDFMHDDIHHPLQAVEFGPNSNQLIYIFNGNIFYKRNVEAETKKLTNGNENILNGIPDMQYEEEIFKRSKCFWFSPNGRYLAFARFNQSKVPQDHLSSYAKEQTWRIEPYVYPKVDTFPFSKAGYPNSVASVLIVDLQQESETESERPLDHQNKRLPLLQALSWSPNSDHLLITWSNQSQSQRLTEKCFPHMMSCVKIILPGEGRTTSEEWIPNLNQPYVFSTEPGVYFHILPRSQGGKGSFNHLAMINYTAKPIIREFLTEGLWEVTKVLHYSPHTKSVFFISNEADSRGRFIYHMNVETKKKSCLTCGNGVDFGKIQSTDILHNVTNSECLYYDALVGKLTDWLLLHCLGPGIPQSYLGIYTMEKQSLQPIPLNISLSHSQTYTQMIMNMYRYGSVNVDGSTINVKVLNPIGNHLNDIPVVVSAGSLGNQQADFRFDVSFAEYLVSRDKIVFVFIDGAGSGYRGNKLLHSVAKKPGHLETNDIKAVLRHMTSKWNIYNSRVGIMGEGYGGYVSIYGLTDQQSNIRCGVGFRPIVDWKVYSSIESAKVMGNLNTNAMVYETSNLLYKASLLRGRQLLLCHGLRDRLISPQHSILLEHAAIDEELPVGSIQAVYYGKQDHRFSDKKSRVAMFKKTRQFFLSCLTSDTVTSVE